MTPKRDKDFPKQIVYTFTNGIIPKLPIAILEHEEISDENSTAEPNSFLTNHQPPTRTSTVRIDKVYHIHPPNDFKKERSNSKLQVSHYIQHTSPSIQPNIAKSEPIIDNADDESAQKKENVDI